MDVTSPVSRAKLRSAFNRRFKINSSNSLHLPGGQTGQYAGISTSGYDTRPEITVMYYETPDTGNRSFTLPNSVNLCGVQCAIHYRKLEYTAKDSSHFSWE